MTTLEALRDLVAIVRPVEELMRGAAGPRAGYDCDGCGDGFQLTSIEAERGCPESECAGALTPREPAPPEVPEDPSAWVLRECSDDLWADLAHHLALAEDAIAEAELEEARPSIKKQGELVGELVRIDQLLSLGQVRL
jgi:hypothetical protein